MKLSTPNAARKIEAAVFGSGDKAWMLILATNKTKVNKKLPKMKCPQKAVINLALPFQCRKKLSKKDSKAPFAAASSLSCAAGGLYGFSFITLFLS
jgi:hypothetical protein